jgi:hypothetical protein
LTALPRHSILRRTRSNRGTGPANAFALALALACAACSTATGPSADPAAASRETNMAGFVLTSPSFDEGGAIPIRHSCDGDDISPALDWEGAPRGTASLALIVDDPDARGFTHWVMYDIPGGSSGSLREGLQANDFPPQGRNDFGRTGYGGPCPPSGTHHYRFTLWALSSRLVLSGAPSASDVRAAAASKSLGQTTLTGTYTRG